MSSETHQVNLPPVYYVHEVELPDLSVCEFPPLSKAVQYDKILQNVSHNVDFTGWSSRARQQWYRWFSSSEAKLVVDGLYWITIARTFKALSFPSHPFISQLLARVSKAHVQLYLSIPPNKRDFFFDRFSDGVAQAVLFSIFLAFPKSRTEITSGFCSRLLADIAETLTGIRPVSTSVGHWQLNLGGGDVLRISSSSQATSTSTGPSRLPPIGGAKLKLRFSPIIAAYLTSRHYRYFKKIKETSVGDSMLPESTFDAPSVLQEVDERLQRGRREVELVEQMNRRDEREALKELRESRLRLEARSRQKSQYKEFSNYLTSLHILQREPHEHVSLTLLNI